MDDTYQGYAAETLWTFYADSILERFEEEEGVVEALHDVFIQAFNVGYTFRDNMDKVP